MAKPRRTDERGAVGPVSAESSSPNGLAQGRVSRTMWPPSAGTQRLLQAYGESLVCVRHREDPAGYRRVVTVELVIGPVAPRAGQRRLRDGALYPVAIRPSESILRAQLRSLGARCTAASAWCYVRGDIIKRLQLEDRIIIRRQAPKKKAQIATAPE